ncbi:MAG: hypothetical protein IIB73_03705 [Proteobacteria bacterium]|nr:hypothetical protein [Pseudomonadota bacterium]
MLVDLDRGRVYGIELREMGPTRSHKDFMVAGLITLNVMAGGLQREGLDTLVDAGFYNSALSLRHYAKILGFNFSYFIR